MIAFGNADNINKVPVYITTEFEQQDGTKKLYLITLNYDLENLSVNSYQIHVITSSKTNGGN